MPDTVGFQDFSEIGNPRFLQLILAKITPVFVKVSQYSIDAPFAWRNLLIP